MKHLQDQDLLLLAHRSLGPVRSIGAKLHLARCKDCRARYGAYASLSLMVASLVRVGMPAWKPLGLALSLKVLVAASVVGVGLYGLDVAISSPSAPPKPPVVKQIESPLWPSCPDGKAAPKKGRATPATMQLNLNVAPPTRRKR